MKKAPTKRQQELAALAKMKDSDIDYSDIPPITEIPSDAVIGKFYRPKKEMISLRLDADVLAWLKSSGDGYQTKLNNHLRKLMNRSR